MKRHTFLISSAGSLVAAGGVRGPVLAALATSDARAVRVAVRRRSGAGATPGGCANRSRRSDAYTLAFALTGRR
jgi:hypothetical protein